jgi:hypothetical protein
MKRIFLILLLFPFLLENIFSQSEAKNLVYYTAAAFVVPKQQMYNFVYRDFLLEFGYQRFINKKRSIGANISLWSNLKKASLEESYLANPTTFAQASTGRFKLIDLYFGNALWHKKQHRLDLQTGLSGAFGEKRIATGYYYEGIPDIVLNFKEEKQEKLLGFNTALHYAYNLSDDAVTIGINVKCTYFPNGFLQWSYGFRAGYRF